MNTPAFAPAALSPSPASREQEQTGIMPVIDGGYCIGCGACAALSRSPVKIEMNRHGMYAALPEAGASPASLVEAGSVCPFSEQAPNEDLLGAERFGGRNNRRHAALGYYQSCFGAHVTEGEYRSRGSSGGMGSWIQCALLEHDLADYVINVKPSSKGASDGVLFRYTVCATPEEVRQSAKSRYYPIELSGVMDLVRRQPGRYVIVGLPCFLKAARLLCRADAVLNARLQWFVGLVCGHLKSKRFAEHLAWQVGVPPTALTTFDFRRKLPGQSADRYGIEATGTSERGTITGSGEARELDGCDWGRGYFKYKACDFCDDVLAETADVVVGDAWLPRFSEDWKGTNVVVTRDPRLDALLRTAGEEGRLDLTELTADEVAQSQDAGLRHRRDGLRYRLHLARQRGDWHPPKRVTPSEAHLSDWDRARHRLREAFRDTSHRAFAEALEKNDLSHFRARMAPLQRQHNRLHRPSRLARLRGFLRRLLGPPS